MNRYLDSTYRTCSQIKMFLLQNRDNNWQFCIEISNFYDKTLSGQEIQIMQNNLFRQFGFYREVGHISFPPFFPFLQIFPQLLVTSPLEMEFLNSIFSQGFWAQTRVLSDSSFYLVFYPHFSFLQNAIHKQSQFFLFSEFLVFLKPE